MFNYENYKKELNNISEEEIKAFYTNNDVNQSDEIEKPFILKKSELNKKYNIVFKHELKSAFDEPMEEFYLINAKENNVIIFNEEKQKNYIYTLPYKDIQKIIETIDNNNTIFKKCDIAFSPILDGTQHELYICGSKKDIELSCYNLWYWLDDNAFNSEYIDAKLDEINYTKQIIKCINLIQEHLNNNKIKYKILKN